MWLSKDRVYKLVAQHGSPLYVYSSDNIRSRAKQLMKLDTPYGLTVRYAIKANPHMKIVTLLDREGLHFDASSTYEAMELLELGVNGNKISLSSQQPSEKLGYLLEAGVKYVATSIHQLELFEKVAPVGSELALRINPDMGSGLNMRMTTGGRNSSFGIWHEYLENALAIAKENNLTVNRLQTHIGSGTKPSIWGKYIDYALNLVSRMPDVNIINVGGGYKVSYMDDEPEADMTDIETVFSKKLLSYYEKTGRKLRLEIELGRWMVAHSGQLIAEIVDIVDTGQDGYKFLRTNTGMNDFLRPGIYGSQHKIYVLNNSNKQDEYIVVGHNCETGDVLTPAPHDPEKLLPRQLSKATIGDLILIDDTGAYCASMCTKGYNGYPQAKEILV